MESSRAPAICQRTRPSDVAWVCALHLPGEWSQVADAKRASRLSSAPAVLSADYKYQPGPFWYAIFFNAVVERGVAKPLAGCGAACAECWPQTQQKADSICWCWPRERLYRSRQSIVSENIIASGPRPVLQPHCLTSQLASLPCNSGWSTSPLLRASDSLLTRFLEFHSLTF